MPGPASISPVRSPSSPDRVVLLSVSQCPARTQPEARMPAIWNLVAWGGVKPKSPHSVTVLDPLKHAKLSCGYTPSTLRIM
eukprot:1135677-Rhodomonas_salina.1